MKVKAISHMRGGDRGPQHPSQHFGVLQGLLWLLLGSVLAGSSLCSATTFPRYRQLIEQQEESTPANEDLEEEYAEQRILAEQYYCKSPRAAWNALMGMPVHCEVSSNRSSTEPLSFHRHGRVPTQPLVGPYSVSIQYQDQAGRVASV